MFNLTGSAKSYSVALSLIYATALVSLHASCARAAADTELADTLDEIVVTAQKKSERAQDVGISITALNATEIVDLGIKDSADVAGLAPSVQFQKIGGSAYTIFNIRGVAQNDYGDQQEAPVAIYQDDSYASTLNLAGFPVFDTERIEVLRGPQGTLFGRNATGGAIQFVSKRPTTDFEADVSATAGSFGEFDSTTSISGPLTDRLQGRLAVYSAEHGSWLSNTAAGGGDRGGLRRLAVRAELAAQPFDNLTGLVTVRYAHDGPDSDAGAYQVIPSYPNPVTGAGEYLTVHSSNPNPWGTCPGCDATGYRDDAINASLGGDPWTIHSFGLARMDRTITGATVHLDATVGGLNLVSVSDFQHMNKVYDEGDAGNDGLALVQYESGNRLSQFTQEVRVSGDVANNSWIAGAFFMRVGGRYYGWYEEPFYDYYPFAAFTQDTTSGAVFGQDEIKFGAGWKIIGGVRLWEDERTLNYSVYDNTGNYPPSDPIVFNPATAPGLANRTFRNYSTKLEIDRQFAPDILGYLSFNRGTKSGGFEASVATPYGGLRQQFLNSIPYNQERLNAYELGLKSTWFDGKFRVNGDVFDYDYRGFQGYEQLGAVQSVKNLNAREWGAELEAEARPLRGLTLSVGMSSLHSTLYNVTEPSLAVVDTQLPQSPHFSGNALIRYEHPLQGGVVGIQLTGRWWDNFCWSVFCGAVDVERPGFTSDARLSYDIGRFSFAVGVSNLTNRVYRTFDSDLTAAGGITLASYAPPRWYTGTVAIRLGGTH